MFCKIYQGIVHIPDVPLAQLFFSFWEVSLSGGLPAIMCVFKQKKKTPGPVGGRGTPWVSLWPGQRRAVKIFSGVFGWLWVVLGGRWVLEKVVGGFGPWKQCHPPRGVI